ncbi:MaoC family dehydratase [Neorhizobium sp. BT27B]|uniref:MaoC family dehydratase n=1 Tax=Neorhizobium sp. BT27B TaxID=3142625 RepID=UPI003D26AB7B
MRSIGAFERDKANRYVERQGLYYDEFNIGDVILHRPSRTITEADNTWMSLLCHNVHPLHIDNDYASRTEFGRPVVSSLVTLSIITGMTTRSTSANAIANLGWDEVRLTRPVFVGDTIHAETTIQGKRISESRENCGIVSFKTVGKTADDQIFMSFVRHALIPTCPGGTPEGDDIAAP